MMAHFGTGPTVRPASTPAADLLAATDAANAARAARRATPAFNRGSGSPAPSTPAPVRKNKYGAKCVNCGGWVPEGAGRLTNERGQWVVSHIPPCPDPDAQYEPVAKPAAAAGPAVPKVPFSVPDGRYTVSWGDHHKTIRVHHQDEFDDFMPGKVILEFLSGPDNTRDYTSFAHVADDGSVRVWKKHQGNEALREAVKVLLGDPKAASKAYAKESECCGVCNRELTNPESLARLMGPVCAEKNGWA
jgi:hypothetical protein